MDAHDRRLSLPDDPDFFAKWGWRDTAWLLLAWIVAQLKAGEF